MGSGSEFDLSMVCACKDVQNKDKLHAIIMSDRIICFVKVLMGEGTTNIISVV